jgi:nucleolar protein 56
MVMYVLYESASGYGLFEVVESEEIGSIEEEVQAAVADMGRFGRTVKFKAFQPFANAEAALENINNVSEGTMTDDLKNFLEMNLPSQKIKAGKTSKHFLGVVDPKIGTAIQEGVGFPCKSNQTVIEILRGIRMHFKAYVKALDNGGLEKAQLGLGHSYSRCKVKFNVNRSDNMIIQSICLLDQLDKDINTFAMRVKEWYSWHFPELLKCVTDMFVYARVIHYIQDKNSLNESRLPGLTELTMDEDVSEQILKAARSSMGMDMSSVDMKNVMNFVDRLISLGEFRKSLHEYLVKKMGYVAPNLGALIGEMVAARLISHAGSLTNLAKCPASTVQILGAEKALFRALKTKGNTPKYGLIFHSSFIGRASQKNKGRISRYLANKCAIASRIDSFADEPSTVYGEKMKDQVEERLAFYDSGKAPRKNLEVMREAAAVLAAQAGEEPEEAGEKKSKKSKSKKSKEVEPEAEEEPKKKKKKKKAEEEPVAEEEPKKKKKKKSKD